MWGGKEKVPGGKLSLFPLQSEKIIKETSLTREDNYYLHHRFPHGEGSGVGLPRKGKREKPLSSRGGGGGKKDLLLNTINRLHFREEKGGKKRTQRKRGKAL